jgi:hypothetical protein
VIDSLIGMRHDLGAAKARIVSASGFTEGAKKAGIVCQTLKYTDAESRRIQAEWYSPDAPDGAYRGDCLDSDYDTSRSLGRVVFDNRDPLDIEFPLFVSWHLHWGDPFSTGPPRSRSSATNSRTARTTSSSASSSQGSAATGRTARSGSCPRRTSERG